jgi:SAM-dependent methyltransferase
MLDQLGPLPEMPRILDAGCSTGYLLQDLVSELPNALLVGIDYVFAGLPLARMNAGFASLLQADAVNLPIAHNSIDVIVSANLLEHIPDDVAALKEFSRVLRPEARAIIAVPAGPQLYDYYDRFLLHQRRYGRQELHNKALLAGFSVVKTFYIGSLIYPLFFLLKKRNRLLRAGLNGLALAEQVSRDISVTQNSALGHRLVVIERSLLAAGLNLPIGIRQVVVLVNGTHTASDASGNAR